MWSLQASEISHLRKHDFNKTKIAKLGFWTVIFLQERVSKSWILAWLRVEIWPELQIQLLTGIPATSRMSLYLWIDLLTAFDEGSTNSDQQNICTHGQAYQHQSTTHCAWSRSSICNFRTCEMQDPSTTWILDRQMFQDVPAMQAQCQKPGTSKSSDR